MSARTDDYTDFDVAIIGGGFSGTIVAIRILAAARAIPQATRPSGLATVVQNPIRILLLERNPLGLGRGAAFGTTSAKHYLNVPSRRMSAFDEDPEHFVRWLEGLSEGELHTLNLTKADIAPDEYLPRIIYGRYLRSILDQQLRSEAANAFTCVHGEVASLEPPESDRENGPISVRLTGRTEYRVKRVVLALGNFPPRDLLARFHAPHHPSYISTPWKSVAFDNLSGNSDVLVIGSGLTCLDILHTLYAQTTGGAVHVVSRHGLFPQIHKFHLPSYPFFLRRKALPKTILGLLRAVRKEVAIAETRGIDWRSVVDSMRPHLNEIWQSLPLEQQKRFLRHLNSFWEIHRHRAAPKTQIARDALSREGRLRTYSAQIRKIERIEDRWNVTLHQRCGGGASSTIALQVDYIINCTGPQGDYSKLDDRFVKQLIRDGWIVRDALHLGIATGEHGGVLNRDDHESSRVFTLGPTRKGQLWETTAVNGIREQTKALAAHIAALWHEEMKDSPPRAVPRRVVHRKLHYSELNQYFPI